MLDILGKEIELGDRVAFSRSTYSTLKHGVVVGITEKKIRIQESHYNENTLKFPDQVAVVEKGNA